MESINLENLLSNDELEENFRFLYFDGDFGLEPIINEQSFNIPINMLTDNLTSIDTKQRSLLLKNTISDKKYTSRIENYFKNKTKRPNAIPIVALGDSWLHMPVIHDIVDYLYVDESYNILSYAKAGTEIKEVIEASSQWIQSIKNEKPKYLIISAGGNDILEDVTKYLIKNKNTAEDINECFNDEYRKVKIYLDNSYSKIINSTLKIHPDISKIIIHGYNYPYPSFEVGLPFMKGKWLAKPMSNHGITNQYLQKEILVKMIDDLYLILTSVAKKPQFQGKVQIANFRRVIMTKDHWLDEIHPKGYVSKSYADILKKYLI